MIFRSTLISLYLLSCNFAFAQNVPYSKEKIDIIITKTDSLFSIRHKSFTLKRNISSRKVVTESWTYLKNSKGLSCFKISYTIDSTDYKEAYFLDKGNLIYATEIEVSRFPASGPDDFIVWSGLYYFSYKKLIDHMTNGHGKSELDGWDPEKETLLRYNKRRFKRTEFAN